MDIGIRELKAHLSEHLERVANGEVITVTSRGRRVAQIVPATSASARPLAPWVSRWSARRRPGSRVLPWQVSGSRRPRYDRRAMSNQPVPDPVEATFRDLRGAVYTGDGRTAMAAIQRRPDLDTLQYIAPGRPDLHAVP